MIKCHFFYAKKWVIKYFNMQTPSPEAIKLFSRSTQLNTKIIQLTIVGILTFISMINITYERLIARSIFISRYFSFCEQLKFCAQVS